MLELMPRAQYVGYTATPFANVFVDPSDDVGIFPKDFVIGARRPDGYMGCHDFHDLDEVKASVDVSQSNEAALFDTFRRTMTTSADNSRTGDSHRHVRS